MATLAACTTADFRERMLRWIFLGQFPPWEDTTGGSPATWPFTQFVHWLCKTGDPGETGSITTNEADFTGYARLTSTRGAGDYGILGGGTSAPSLQIKKALTWAANGGALQAIHAVGLGMRHSATDYEIMRHVLASPIDVDTAERFNISGGQCRIALDTAVASSTAAAAFDSWEEMFALYLALGGTLGYTGSFPGLVTNSPSEAYLTLLNADPRAALVYPNVYTNGGLNPTYDPTLAEYEGYSYVTVDRSTGGDLEAIEDGAGVWKVRNTAALTFPNALGASTGGTWPYVGLLLPDADGNFYLSHVGELDAAFTVPAGGAGGLNIPIGDFELEMR